MDNTTDIKNEANKPESRKPGDIFKNLNVKRSLVAIISVLILLFTFSVGVFVGVEKARFSYGWRDNYYRNFIGPDRMPPDRNNFNAHGELGDIIKIASSTITIKGIDNVEKIVVVTGQTAIRDQNQNLKITDLMVGDKVVVIGTPNNQGQIEARLIRIAPADFTPPNNQRL